MNFSKIKKIHFIGVEGAGTSALATLLQKNGKEVSGSDEGDHFLLFSFGRVWGKSFS